MDYKGVRLIRFYYITIHCFYRATKGTSIHEWIRETEIIVIEGKHISAWPCNWKFAPLGFITLSYCIYLIELILFFSWLLIYYSYTFEITQMDTDSIWKFMRFNTIREYCDRTPLPAPFCLISHLYLLLQQFSRKCCKQRGNKINSLSKWGWKKKSHWEFFFMFFFFCIFYFTSMLQYPRGF